MLVKASIAATVILVATVTAHTVNFRELYNEMYPVNGLKRDVLGLCHQATPTFVRAVRSDREDCYDSMPDSVETAIGWVRTTTRLTALKQGQTAVETAERILKEVAAQRRLNLPEGPQFTGYLKTPAAQPCPQPAALVPAGAVRQPLNQAEARRRGEDPALAALGLAPKGQRPGQGKAPLDATAGANTGMQLVPAGTTNDPTGCKTPI